MADEVDEYGLVRWPAPERNKDPILQQLREVLPQRPLRLLEIAAGTGQHAAYFAEHLTHVEYHPSDYDEAHLRTLGRRVEVCGPKNLKPPVRLDVTAEEWPLCSVDVIYNANMVHIAPWEVAEGLFRGAGRILVKGGLLLTYGPYKIDGRHTSPSNEQFDESLRSRDETWGVRDLSELAELATVHGLVFEEKRAMPANNFFVVWKRV